MAEFRISVVVDPTQAKAGTEQVKQGLKNTTKEADKLQKAIHRAIAFIGVGVAVKQLYSLSEAYQNMQNKTRNVTSSQAQLQAVMDRVFRISQDTRSSWEASTDMFTRASLATKDLGLSLQDTLNFMEDLNYAVGLSGVKTVEASNAMVQLSQGLSAGALRGDELRSVLEQLPAVADVIARGMNVTRGELRKLGADGKITAEIIIDSFKKAHTELKDRFGRTVPTMGQSFQVLRNSAIKFFGELGQKSGVVRVVTTLIQGLAANFDTFGRILLAVVDTIAVAMVARAIPKLIGAIKLLWAAMAANPWMAAFIALTAIVALLVQFGDKMKASRDGIAKISDVLGVLWNKIKAAVSALLRLIGDVVVRMVQWFDETFEVADVTFENILLIMAAFVDAGIGLFKFFTKALILVFGGLPVAVGEIFFGLLNTILDGLEWAINEAISGINYLPGVDIDAVDLNFRNPLAGATDTLATEMKDAFNKIFEESTVKDAVKNLFAEAEAEAGARKPSEQVDLTKRGERRVKPPKDEGLDKLRDAFYDLEDSVFPVTAALRELTNAEKLLDTAVKAGLVNQDRANEILAQKEYLLKAQMDPFRAVKDAMMEEIELLKYADDVREAEVEKRKIINDLLNQGIRLSVVEVGQIDRLQRMKAKQVAINDQLEQQREREKQILEDLRGPMTDYLADFKTVNALYDDGRITALEYDKAMAQLQERWDSMYPHFTTWNEGFLDAMRSIRDEMLNVGTLVESTFVNAFHGVENALVDMVVKGKADWAGLVDSMLADLTRLLLRMMLINSIKFGAGALGLSVPGFATGGQFKVGGAGGTDSQLVAFKATPGERVTVQTGRQQQEDGASSAAPVNLRVINVNDARDTLNVMSSNEGERVILNIMRKHATALKNLSK